MNLAIGASIAALARPTEDSVFKERFLIMPKPDVVNDLNDQQRQAVEAHDGPLLVLAGAGTGKTRVITARIAHLIQAGVPAERILAVTFTRKAAGEMEDRVRATIGSRACAVTIATFHALGFRILREWRARSARAGPLRVINEDEQRRLLGDLLIDAECSGDLESVLERISLAKNAGTSPEEYRNEARTENEAAIAAVYERYQETLSAAGAIDLDDMVLRSLTLLESCARTRAELRERWRYLLIDEYQDTSGGQDRIAACLLGVDQNVCVVGDDDQSIYSFRGADVERIRTFADRMPGTRTVKLESNYRSRSAIIALANAVIEKARKRCPKRLLCEAGHGEPVEWTVLDRETDECAFIAKQLHELAQGFPWSSMAVLFRTRQHAVAFFDGLRRKGIPCGTTMSRATVTVMTLHQAKGLEFPVVFLPVMEDGILPHGKALRGTEQFEEERRLFYVGITRARERLFITSATHGTDQAQASPFLQEVVAGDFLRVN